MGPVDRLVCDAHRHALQARAEIDREPKAWGCGPGSAPSCETLHIRPTPTPGTRRVRLVHTHSLSIQCGKLRRRRSDDHVGLPAADPHLADHHIEDLEMRSW